MFRKRLQKRVSSRGTSPGTGRRLDIENLEDRRLLSADPGWALSFGNAGFSTIAQQTVVDLAGNTYVSGSFNGTVDLDQAATHPGNTDILTAFGSSDGYIAKYDSTGGFLWARRMGGTGGGYAGPLTLDGFGHLYVAGVFTDAADFDQNGTFEVISNGGEDVFVMQLAADTGAFQWVRSFGGTTKSGYQYPDWAYNVAADIVGNVFVTGVVYDASGQVDLNPGPGVAMAGSGSYVVKLDISGNYLTSWGGIPTNDYYARAKMTVDDTGVYLSSDYKGTFDFSGQGLPGATKTALNGSSGDDIFLAKYSLDGQFLWVRTLGDSLTAGSRGPWGIALDAGHVYITGLFQGGLDLDGNGTVDLSATGGGGSDIFVASFGKTDGTLAWAQALGTTGEDWATNLAIDSAGSLFVIGHFANTLDFDPGLGVSSLTALTPTGTSSNTDGFLWKLDAASGSYQSVWRLGLGAGGVAATGITVDTGGFVYVSGKFEKNANFPNGLTRTATGTYDAFVLKLNPTAPRVTITSPTSNQTLLEGATLSFAGTAIDDLDGNLTSSIVWQSQLTGTLGTGGSIGPITMGVGAHLVTARATDSDGLVGSSGISVLVNPKAPTNLTGTVSGSQVTLHWLDKSGGETAYSIERAVKPSRSATPVWSVVATLAANTVAYVESPGKGNWLYQVQAKGTGVASAYSNQLSVTVTKSAPTSATLSLALTAEPQATTLTASEVTSSTSVSTSSSDATSQPKATGLLLAPTKPSAKSKLADAALAPDESWFDGALEDDLLLDLVAAR